MAKLKKNTCRAIVYNQLLLDGWLPAGTTDTNWWNVTVGQLQLDDPPLPSDPHFQKKKLALELQAAFIRLNSALSSPLAQLKSSTQTLDDLAIWCFENQVEA